VRDPAARDATVSRLPDEWESEPEPPEFLVFDPLELPEILPLPDEPELCEIEPPPLLEFLVLPDDEPPPEILPLLLPDEPELCEMEPPLLLLEFLEPLDRGLLLPPEILPLDEPELDELEELFLVLPDEELLPDVLPLLLDDREVSAGERSARLPDPVSIAMVFCPVDPR